MLLRAAERGDNLGAITAALLRLLERYGAAELDVAIHEASSAACRIPTRCASRWNTAASPTGAARRRPAARARPARCDVQPHRLEAYDQLKEQPMSNLDALHDRAHALHLHGLLAHWAELPRPTGLRRCSSGRSGPQRRSLDRRVRAAHIGRFKPLCDFDWHWPKRCDRAVIEELMTLDFLKDATNVILIGPNGVGKSMIAQNIAHQALIHGHTVLFTTAGHLLGELAALDSDSALRRRSRTTPAPTF